MLDIDLDLIPRLQVALQQNGVEPITLLRLTHTGDEPLADLTLRIRLDPAISPELVRPIDRIDPGTTLNLSDLRLALSTERLVNQTEREAGHLHLGVHQGEALLVERSVPIEILACNEWPGAAAPPELLGAFVLPNHPAIGRLLSAARDLLAQRTDRPELNGYQSRDPARVLAVAGAIYDAVAALGITYVNPPASFERAGQKVRTPDQILDARMGTCLDLTVLLAAALEQAGLRPLLILVEGHAFPGVWLTEWAFPVPSLDDPIAVRKRVDLGEILVFDSSSAAQKVPFNKATATARAHLDATAAFGSAVDLWTARRTGIRPLPLRSGATFQALPEPDLQNVGQLALPDLPVAPDAPTVSGPSTRLEHWKSRLLDLSLNNRMINHRDGKRVLPLLGGLKDADLASLEDTLAQGTTLTLAPRPQNPTESPGVLWLDLAPAEANRRMVELYRTSRSYLQESGTNATFLALGFLRWFESSRATTPRHAPLILLPVHLDRGSVRGPYTVRLADEDPLINSSLLQKLSTDFGLDTAGYDEVPTDDHGVDVARILTRFRALVRDLDRFEVQTDAAITLYNFRKFLMWMDLQQRTEDLLANPVVRLLVDPTATRLPDQAPFLSPDKLDTARPARDDLSVVDADSSQLSAVYGALDGNSFVLQGPPGTGKSQTITNLIAQALAREQTVLFVAEKRAALDVVRDRLHRVGLGEFCLEAHSEKASKREVIRQFEAPLRLAHQAPPTDWKAHAEALQGARVELNAYVGRMHSPGPFDESLFQAISELIGLRDAPYLPLPVPAPDTMTLTRMHGAIEVLAERIAGHEPPAQSRWAMVGHPDWSPRWAREVEGALDTALAAWDAAEGALREAVGALTLPMPTTEAELEAYLRLITRLLNSTQPPAALLTTPQQQVDGLLSELTGLGAERDAAWSELSQRFQPTLLDRDLDAEAERFRAWAASFFLIAFIMLFFARRRLAPLAAGALPDNAQVAADLKQAVQIQSLDQRLSETPEAARLLGHRFKGPATDWSEVEAIHTWSQRFRRSLAAVQGTDPVEAERRRQALIALATGELLAPGAPLRQQLEQAYQTLQGWYDAKDHLLTTLGAEALGPQPLAARRAHLDDLRESTAALQAHTACLRAAEAARALGLDPLVEALMEGRLLPGQASRALDRAIREQWVEARFEEDEGLRHFRGVDHEARIARFRALDTEARQLAQREIRARLIARLPDPHAPGEMATLRREIRKSRAHMPVRKLFSEIPNVLPRLKPCVLMSPLSVAQYLDPAVGRFDLVVFDEASQIPPWDAIGAIARGDQVIVVGDSKQLPPTTFFQRGGDEEPDDDDIQDLESILDECVAAGLPSHPLRWHYRSRHESLIAFSNQHYYENNLYTFPSALAEVPHLGVKWVHVPEGVYDKGRTRTNRAEAEAVVAEIVRRLKDPVLAQRSIGVVTFSMTQQRLIEDLLDQAMTDPEVEQGAHQASEPLFIKNLENVQGDERDVMLFSVGYGPDAEGRVAMNFGPLNRTGGERRLNVAITRAKQLLIVFSTLRPEQIDLSRTRAVGVAHFKTFLDYAARGPRAIDAAGQHDRAAPASPFEDEVAKSLRALGYEVHQNVGFAGYRLDLAITDPDTPGAYLLGIECDGATYHSARAARDRDRTRAAVLTGLGWRLHRIWSTDWWHNPEAELQRAVEAIEEATRARSSRPTPALPAPPAPTRPSPAEAPGADRERFASGTDPFLDRGPSWPEGATRWDPQPILSAGPREQFYSEGGQIVAQIVAAAHDAPLQLDEVIREVASAWGFARAGSQIRERIEHFARQTREVQVVEGVLWRTDQDPHAWMGFRYCEGEDRRDLQTVPLREIANASAWVLQRAVALSSGELHREVASIFGAAQVGRRMRERIDEGVELLIREGRVEREDETLRLSSDLPPA